MLVTPISLLEKKLLANDKNFLWNLPFIFGGKNNHIPSTSALLRSLFLVAIILCFA